MAGIDAMSGRVSLFGFAAIRRRVARRVAAERVVAVEERRVSMDLRIRSSAPVRRNWSSIWARVGLAGVVDGDGVIAIAVMVKRAFLHFYIFMLGRGRERRRKKRWAGWVGGEVIGMQEGQGDEERERRKGDEGRLRKSKDGKRGVIK